LSTVVLLVLKSCDVVVSYPDPQYTSKHFVVMRCFLQPNACWDQFLWGLLGVATHQ